MRYVLTVWKIIRYILLIMVAFPTSFAIYIYEVYISLAIMTFKGHKPKRIKKSYYDTGYVIYKPELDNNKRFENQIVGAIVFIPITFFLLIFLIFTIYHYGKKFFAA